MFDLYLEVDPNRYKTIRKTLGLTAQRFAELTKTTRKTVYNFENGCTKQSVTIGMALMLRELAKSDPVCTVVWSVLIDGYRS